MQQIIFIENQIEDLEKQISILLSKTNQVITTISGIGETLGAIIISEIGEFIVSILLPNLLPLPL